MVSLAPANTRPPPTSGEDRKPSVAVKVQAT